MATLDDDVLERLQKLNGLRDRALNFRERGRKALAKIPADVDLEKLKSDHDLSSDQWVSGSHPVDLALVVRVLNNQGLRGEDFEPCCEDFHDALKDVVTSLFKRSGCSDTESENGNVTAEVGNGRKTNDNRQALASDPVPVLTAARAMHALVGKSKTVFSTATMLCYYQIVRELYLATFPNWIIGAARAGEGGRVSAFVTGECVRAVLAFQNSIQDTITFFTTTKKLWEELERLKQIPDVKSYLSSVKGTAHWEACKKVEVERIVLDWYAANNLRRNVIALDLSTCSRKDASTTDESKSKDNAAKGDTSEGAKRVVNNDGTGVFRLDNGEIELKSIEEMLENLPDLLQLAIQEAVDRIAAARDEILEFRKNEAGRLDVSHIKNLPLIAKRLKENPHEAYHYYRLALQDKTLRLLDEYWESVTPDEEGLRKHTSEGNRSKAEELKAALVNDLNNNFKGHLVACAKDWDELVRRTNNRKERKFSKETEWLVERYLGLIKLANKNPKWEGTSELIQLNRIFLEDAFCEDDEKTSALDRVDRRRFDATSSAHALALRVVGEALDEAERAKAAIKKAVDSKTELPKILDEFHEQYRKIDRRIRRVIEPAKRYIQDVLNRELAHAANSSKFDAGELLFAAASFGALTKWKENEQLAEARSLLIDLLPEDGRFQTNRPIQSTSQGLQLMPIAFEMTRCFAQLLRKDFGEDLDPKIVRKLLNLFEDNPIQLTPGVNDRIGWNFGGAPESEKPSVWVTAVGVFALDRTIRMLNERINAMVLRNFNVDWPQPEGDGSAAGSSKLNLSNLMNSDYELQCAFAESEDLKPKYDKTPSRMVNVSLAIRLQQMRAHLTRAVLPTYYSKGSKEQRYKKAYNAIFYGPPGTGKTTLAEALATTARVPLVRLSPSDLMVQGTDVIESRARAIFGSLSMLTQAVIFLDEFEPVVRTRSEPKDEDEPADESSKAAAMPSDPAEFRFLVTGMLPKLTKLNEVAAVQSVVYLLATNHLVQIDDAAKRAKRFDLHLPIYNPDPMSRLLALFYQLISVLKKEPVAWQAYLPDLEKNPESWAKLEEELSKEVDTKWLDRLNNSKDDQEARSQLKELLEVEARNMWQNRLQDLEKDREFWDRVREAIEKTTEVSAQSLSTVFFSPKSSKNFVTYVRGGNNRASPGKPTSEEPSDGKKTPVEKDIELQRQQYEEAWKARPREQSSQKDP